MRKTILMLSAAATAAVPVAASAQAARNLQPRYVQEAQQQHAALIQEFGGAETGARAAYVDQVGRRMAVHSGVNPQAFRFTTLNSAVENAFAVPGGYIYITRQLMGLMNDEAELAFVVGHEVGHVAANHAQARQSASRNNSIGSVLGAILGSVIGGGIGSALGQLLQTGSQLRTLSFTRAQEYDADRLGVNYLVRAGYDPNASASMLAALARADALELRRQGRDQRETPEWAQTHPSSANRIAQASSFARQTGRVTGLRNRDQFLSQLDGITVDDDPAQGIIDGRTFTHPDLRLQFSVPTGYLMQNGTDAVTISGGTAGKAQFSTGRYNGNLEAYIGQELQQLTGGRTQLQVIDQRRTTINGIPAAYVIARANTSSGLIDVSMFAYEFARDRAYHFVTLTRGGQGVGPFTAMVNSLRRISPGEATAIRPRVIDVVQVRAGETVQSLAGRMAYRDYQLERFLTLNGLTANARLVPGQRVKLVVYGARAR
jgi:predicted Zn-dependent protease